MKSFCFSNSRTFLLRSFSQKSKTKWPNLSLVILVMLTLEASKSEGLLGGVEEVVDVGGSHGRRPRVDELED